MQEIVNEGCWREGCQGQGHSAKDVLKETQRDMCHGEVKRVN
jgi:hypothetical protein